MFGIKRGDVLAKNNPKEAATRYVFISIFVCLIVLSLLLIKPYLGAILGGVVLVLLFYPLYKISSKVIKNKNLNALIVTIITILIVFIPVAFLLQQVSYQAKVAYVVTRQKLVGGQLVPEHVCEEQNNLMCDINTKFNKLLTQPSFIYYRDRALEYTENILWEITPNIIIAIPKIFLNLFILLFVMFYSFRDGPSLVNRVIEMLPLKKTHKIIIIKKVKDVNKAILVGHVITAVVQGVLATIGFYIFGVTSPIILGILLTATALLPFFGAPLVWVPVALIRIIEGLGLADQKIFLSGVGLFLYGMLVVSTVDNLIKPKIVGDKVKVNPVLMLLGLLGGIALFGIVGIIIGPLILTLTKTFIEIYEKEKHEITG